MKHWYGEHWRQLRTQTLKCCLSHADALPAKIDAVAVSRFIETVTADIRNRIYEDRMGLWEKALPLFADPDKLRDWLLADRKILARGTSRSGKPVHRRQALGRRLSQYFEQARRELVAHEMDVNPHRLKTWERLDRLSREIAHGQDIENRCTDAHFAELAAAVRERFPRDRNLPRTPDTIQTYFFKFSHDCRKPADDPQAVLDNAPAPALREIMRGVGAEVLAVCLDKLEPIELEYMDVEFDLGLSTVQYRKKSDFFTSRALSESSFAIRLREILDKLRDCLELALARTAQGVMT